MSSTIAVFVLFRNCRNNWRRNQRFRAVQRRTVGMLTFRHSVCRKSDVPVERSVEKRSCNSLFLLSDLHFILRDISLLWSWNVLSRLAVESEVRPSVLARLRNWTETLKPTSIHVCRTSHVAATGIQWPTHRRDIRVAGASIPMGQGGHVPPIFGLGGHYHECPPQYF